MASEDQDSILTDQAGDFSTKTVSDNPDIRQSASQQEHKGAFSQNCRHEKSEEQPENESSNAPESAEFEFQDAHLPLEVCLLCWHESYLHFSG